MEKEELRAICMPLMELKTIESCWKCWINIVLVFLE